MATTELQKKRRRTKKRQHHLISKSGSVSVRTKNKKRTGRSKKMRAGSAKVSPLIRFFLRQKKRFHSATLQYIKNVPRTRRVKPWMFLVGLTLGLNLLLVSGWYVLYSKTVLSFATVPQVTARLELRGSIPVKIEIPSISLDQPLVLGSIIDGVWTISPTSPTYLANSARPAEGGNIVVYGHNKNSIFGGLRRVRLQDVIVLTTESEKTHQYIVREIVIVKPTDIAVVLPTDNEVLTVYTCTGFFDSMRLVIKAYPKGVR
ncbi:MAG TPA: sortase [Patescibacteria group bacterium]|nr:sortase [Patescibacteria group bacterium]